MPAVGGVFVDWRCFNSTGIQPVSGGSNIRHPEGKMPQPQCFRFRDSLGRIGVDEQLNHHIAQPQHSQIVLLHWPPGFFFHGKAQLIHIKIQRFSFVGGNDCHMVHSFQHGHISWTLWGNRELSVWGRKQAATKESI